jgi:hypothetical protein
MRTRYAVAAGVAVVVAAVAIFLASSERRVIGTNVVAPLYGAVALTDEQAVCERAPHVPAGAEYVRLRVELTETVIEGSEPSASIRGLRVALSDPRGPIAKGTVRDFREGPVEIPLSRETRRAREGRFCVRGLDRRLLSLFGERKRRFKGARPPRLQGGPRRYLDRFAIAFLQAEPSSRLARADAVADRYRFGHAGGVGGWALWVAGLLALAASALALWLVVKGLPPR